MPVNIKFLRRVRVALRFGMFWQRLRAGIYIDLPAGFFYSYRV